MSELSDVRRQKWKARCLFVCSSVRGVVPIRIDENEEVWQYRFIKASFP